MAVKLVRTAVKDRTRLENQTTSMATSELVGVNEEFCEVEFVAGSLRSEWYDMARKAETRAE